MHNIYPGEGQLFTVRIAVEPGAGLEGRPERSSAGVSDWAATRLDSDFFKLLPSKFMREKDRRMKKATNRIFLKINIYFSDQLPVTKCFCVLY